MIRKPNKQIEWEDGSRSWQTLSDLWGGSPQDGFVDYVIKLWNQGDEEEAKKLYELGKKQEIFGAWWAEMI